MSEITPEEARFVKFVGGLMNSFLNSPQFTDQDDMNLVKFSMILVHGVLETKFEEMGVSPETTSSNRDTILQDIDDIYDAVLTRWIDKLAPVRVKNNIYKAGVYQAIVAKAKAKEDNHWFKVYFGLNPAPKAPRKTVEKTLE